MSDTKWGFDKHYGHKTLPSKFHSSASLSLYEQEPFNKKSFRPGHMPAYREGLQPMSTSYVERSQDTSCPMSSYGCHTEMPWTNSLRSPRNPFPGRPTREVRYMKQPTPRSRNDLGTVGNYMPGGRHGDLHYTGKHILSGHTDSHGHHDASSTGVSSAAYRAGSRRPITPSDASSEDSRMGTPESTHFASKVYPGMHPHASNFTSTPR
mmetsp:Transcript_16907/g.48091  ORF Transcript_16907/g.48091 Transcript_16907/m.48091 type:complete len:208 (+) Transcript_16907:89-712(+)